MFEAIGKLGAANRVEAARIARLAIVQHVARAIDAKLSGRFGLVIGFYLLLIYLKIYCQ